MNKTIKKKHRFRPLGASFPRKCSVSVCENTKRKKINKIKQKSAKKKSSASKRDKRRENVYMEEK